MNLTALAVELNTDPTGLGYAAHIASGADNALADLLNLRRDTITVYEPVESHRIAACVTRLAWGAIAAADRSWLQFIISAPFVDATNATLRGDFDALFPNAGNTAATRAALLAMVRRDGSRAEQLFGAGVVVDPLHVARALGRG